MRPLVRHFNLLCKTHPGWTLVGLLLVTGMLCLPALHHLGDCPDASLAGDDCALCLLLNLTFLAVPAVLVWSLARQVASLLGAESGRAPTATATRHHDARGPPLSC